MIPFISLGYDRGLFYYLCCASGQVVDLRADQHVEGHLIAIAPRQWWEEEYRTKQGPNWKAAQNAMIQKSYTVGLYRPDRLRGRGAWWSSRGSVLHLGDRLIVNGREWPLSAATEHIYEAAVPISVNYKNPLSISDAKKFVKICDMLPWDRPIYARYLAGWCAIAPICGALDWRPHIWVTGGSGSGKSTVIDRIVRRVVGDIGLSFQSSTTEAGLRQSLKHDALPVTFDEIDGSGQRAQDRIQNVLELSRAATTEGGANIVKGSSVGNAVTYKIRSCFAFSSIGVFATSRPDETRITVLGLTADGNKERFRSLSAMITDTLSDEYVHRFTARSIKMIPVIRSNYRIFSDAATGTVGDRRAGDQIGALLAGAYSLRSDNVITSSDAEAFIGRQDWSESKIAREETDEVKLFAFLQQVVVRTPSVGGPVDRSIADLMMIASGRQDATANERTYAIATLGLYGMRGDADCMRISLTHSAVTKLLRGTEWEKTWSRTICRLPGTKRSPGGVRFGSVKNRAVEIPYPDDVAEAQLPELAEQVEVPY